MALNLFSSVLIAKVAIAIMPIANTINAMINTQSSPSPIEVAGRAHRTWFVVFVVWAVFSALVTALFTFLLWNAGNKQQDAVQASATVQIEDARQSAAQANERAAQADERAATANAEAGRANESAAKLNERAQKLENDNLQLRTDLENATTESRAKQAELTREQTKLAEEQQKTAEAQREAAIAQLALKKHLEEVAERQKPRTITPEKRARILEILRNEAKGEIKISFEVNNEEALDFARQIVEVLTFAGWNASIVGSAFEMTTPGPLTIFVSNAYNPPAAALQRALEEVGFPTKGFLNDKLPQGHIGMFVGRRP